MCRMYYVLYTVKPTCTVCWRAFCNQNWNIWSMCIVIYSQQRAFKSVCFGAEHTWNTFVRLVIDVFQSEMVVASDLTGILDLDQLDSQVISRLLQVCHAKKKERKNLFIFFTPHKVLWIQQHQSNSSYFYWYWCLTGWAPWRLRQ